MLHSADLTGEVLQACLETAWGFSKHLEQTGSSFLCQSLDVYMTLWCKTPTLICTQPLFDMRRPRFISSVALGSFHWDEDNDGLCA